MKVTITVEDAEVAGTASPPPAPQLPSGNRKTVDDFKTLTVVIPQPPEPPVVISVPEKLQDAVKKLVT